MSRQPLRDMLNETLAALPARRLDDAFRQTWSLLDELYLGAMLSALDYFGIRGEVGELITLDRLLAQDILPRYRRWLQRALDVLVADGYARELAPGTVKVIRSWPMPDLSGLIAEVNERLKTEFYFTQLEAEWLTDAAKNLPAILTEKIHSAEIYTAAATTQFYQKIFPDNHAQLACVVEGIAGMRTGAFSLLEVGAGLGSATHHVLPVVRQHGGRYMFTDISEYFLSLAQSNFAAAADSIDFGLLNLDIRPQFQGYAQHSYDVVLASSMMHDVRDTKLALDNLRALLKPGGHLVILEETIFFRCFDLMSGLQQGFDGFEDEPLRTKNCLLSRERWNQTLREAGFVDVDILGTPGTIAEFQGFHVIVATAPADFLQLSADAVTAYLGEHLPEYMVPRHIVQMQKMPISANGKIDYRALPPIPEQMRQAEKGRVAPRNPLEQKLLDIWQHVMPGHEIGVTDNFFDIGGDSLIATQLIRQINQSLSFNLEMNDFFDNMSIEALARFHESKDIAIDII